MKPMTDKEFVAAGANKCPFCRSDRITYCCGSEMEEGNVIWAECLDCAKEWGEVYELIGYQVSEKYK